ncbi:MAG: glycosyltransferase family 4 protein [Acidobacteriota bacterium]
MNAPRGSSGPRYRLLLVSAVLPFPGASGQQQRVLNKLRALRRSFRITFLTFAPEARRQSIGEELLEHVDEALVLPARYAASPGIGALGHKLRARLWAWPRGLKTSNAVVSRFELTPQRVLEAIRGRSFDAALFEYWHAHETARALQQQIPVVALDMHDLLYESFRRQLEEHPWGRALPRPLRERQIAVYRHREESAWRDFHQLISINSHEHREAQKVLGPDGDLIYAPMGVDLEDWPHVPDPASEPRLAFFGGLGSPHNQRDARICHHEVLPRVREQVPGTSLWIVGSKPPPDIQALHDESAGVVVTGFVEDPVEPLSKAWVVLCPWTGTYGFRSRLVQVMALGVPVVASPDAIVGMDLHHGEGIFLAGTPEAMAARAIELLQNPEQRRVQGEKARRAVEEVYSFDATYGHLEREMVRRVEASPGSRLSTDVDPAGSEAAG